jgi:hypothetical protein
MHRLVRIGIVAAVAICLGTAALAVAESNRYPSAKQIPTVVTGPSAAATADTVEPAIVVLPSAAVPEQPPAASSEAPSTGAVTVDEKHPASALTAPAASAPAPKVIQETNREVVTRTVRDEDDADGHSSDSHNDGSNKPSTESQKKRPGDGYKKD